MSATPDQAILLTTDLSARGDRPMDRAVHLAKSRGAKLVVLHVLEKGPHDNDAIEAARTEITQDLASQDMEAQIIIEGGDVVTRIAENAKACNAAMIVTGVARIGSIGDLIMGAQLERIIHHSPLPVLIAKNRATSAYKRLVAASDLSAPSAYALEQGRALFPELPAGIINAFHVPFEGFLHTDEITEEFRTEQHKQMQKFIGDLPDEVRKDLGFTIEYGETCTVTRQAITDNRTDLAIVGTHGTSGFRANRMGSVARALITCLPCDTLVVRQPLK